MTPRPDENLAQPCRYDLTLPAGDRTVRAVWVTFDRGRDIMRYHSDPDVVAFARQHDLALMMPHQCPARNAHGVGRALFTALEQFALQSGHRELAGARLILLGWTRSSACANRRPAPRCGRSIEAAAGPGSFALVPQRLKMVGAHPFVCDAQVRRAGGAPPAGEIQAGWFPSQRIAEDWRKFVRQPEHPLDSMP